MTAPLENSQYCCALLCDAVNSDRERGLSVVAHRSQKLGDFFYLEFRAVALEHQHSIKSPRDVPLVLHVRQAIRYCPWCGVNLNEHYEKVFEKMPYRMNDDAFGAD